MRAFKEMISIASFAILAFAGMPGALAKGVTVTNTGDVSVLMHARTANGFEYAMVVVPGESVNLLEGTTRFRPETVDRGKLRLEVTRPDGSKSTVHHHQIGKTILIGKVSVPNQTTVRTGYGQGTRVSSGFTVEEGKEQLSGNYSGQPVGIGLGPSPTDGPGSYEGPRTSPELPPELKTEGPTETDRKWEEYKEQLKNEFEKMGVKNPGNLAAESVKFLRKRFKTPEEAEATTQREALWKVVRGIAAVPSSGDDEWGDCLGTDCRPGLGEPGYPYGGPPIGRSVHFDRQDAIFSDDILLLLPTNFRTEFGVDPTEDTRGYPFNN